MKTKIPLSFLHNPIMAGLRPAATRLLLIIALSPLPFALGQIPQGFNYQAVARDADGHSIVNTAMPVRITIQSDTLGGTIFWQELHSTVTTNSFGLINIVIGKGTKIAGVAAFSAIDWSVTPKFIMTEINYGGWINMGSSKLWSVPYALRSKESDQWLTNGTNIYRATGNVGIGTTTPTRKLDVRGVIKGVTLDGAGATAGQFQSWTEGGVPGQRAVYSFYPTFEATPGGYVPRRAADVVGGFNGGNWGTEFLTFNVGSSGSANDVENLTSEKMRITSNGNIGIGTTTPSALLHVAGNTRLNNSMVGDGIELMTYATGNRFAGIDFHGDDTYTDYALRILRNNTGPDANSQIVHRGTGSLDLWTQDGAPIRFVTANNLRMTVTANGNVGLGTSSPNSLFNPYMTIGDALNSSAEITDMTIKTTTNVDYLRFYGIRKVAGNTWGDVSLRIQQRVDATDMGYIEFNPGTAGYDLALGTNNIERLRINYNGNVGIGTTNPTSKLVVQPPLNNWPDDVPLFEVRNKTGVPIFAVYNNGVRILVDHTLGKAVKGGFAVGGYDMTKAGKTVDLMTISPDSIRFNINNDNVGKGLKGGFAVGGYDVTKGPINQDFMYITPQSTSGNGYNTFMGYQAGFHNTGTYNTFFGYQAGNSNDNGWANVFIGYQAGNKNTGSPNPVTYPYWGNFNVFIGRNAGLSNTTGGLNVFVGDNAGFSNTIALENTYIGTGAGALNQTGGNNSFFGSGAGYHNTGYCNTFIGDQSGHNNTGNNNVFIGRAAGYDATGSNKLYIANSSTNTLIYGDFSTGYVGIGTTSPSFPLDVRSSANSNQTYGYLRSNGLTGAESGTNLPYSIHAQYRILASEFNANSDARIKEILELSEKSYDLELIKKLQVRDFKYIDRTISGSEIKKGFIAQEVEKVFPEAVNYSTNYIPDIYSASERIEYNPINKTLTIILNKPHNLKSGDKISLYTDNEEFERYVICVQSETSFTVSDWNKNVSKIFVYGKEVNDFRAIDYDRIFTLGISAIQELSNENDQLKSQNESLQEQVKSLQHRVEKIETMLMKAGGE